MATKFNHWLNQWLARYCELCGQSSQNNICAHCLADLPYLNDQLINISYLDTSAPSGLVTQAHLTAYFDYIYCEFLYQWPIDQMIIQLKFGKELIMAQILGQQLANGLIHHQAPLPDCIIPVPLHIKRLRQRGFNQANEIAKEISKKLRIPIDYTILHRNNYTQAQTELTQEERYSNLDKAFSINKTIPYQHIAIVDDVITTGSTLLTMTHLLKKNGVKMISIWVCAHSPFT